jgi:hypothetical protein
MAVWPAAAMPNGTDLILFKKNKFIKALFNIFLGL